MTHRSVLHKLGEDAWFVSRHLVSLLFYFVVVQCSHLTCGQVRCWFMITPRYLNLVTFSNWSLLATRAMSLNWLSLSRPPITINFDLVTLSVRLLSCNQDIIAAKPAAFIANWLVSSHDNKMPCDQQTSSSLNAVVQIECHLYTPRIPMVKSVISGWRALLINVFA